MMPTLLINTAIFLFPSLSLLLDDEFDDGNRLGRMNCVILEMASSIDVRSVKSMD